MGARQIQVIKVLLIEDAPEDVRVLRQAFAEEKAPTFELMHADRLAMGLKHLASQPVDLVLLDLLLPDSEGLVTLGKVRAYAPQVPIVILTASDDEALALAALQQGAQDYLVKGYVQVSPNLLGRSIRYAIERKRAEEQLRLAHNQTDRLLSSLPSILIGVTEGGLVTHWNAVAEATFGLRAVDVIDKPLGRCGVRWDPTTILTYIGDAKNREGIGKLNDLPFKRPNGDDGLLGITIVPMRSETGDTSGFLLCGADVTERQRTEQERLRLQEDLHQAQKVETIGRFAGGIAHDFNNFLQVILGFAWLIRSRHPQDEGMLKDLQEIVHAAESASGMVRQLLAFSRRQPIQPKVFDINQAIRGMTRLLQQLMGERIVLALELIPAALVVTLDPTGLEQILMNLSANARDSMQKKGTLTIATSRVVMDAAFRNAHSWCTKEGDYVHLSIADTGTGMDPRVAAHIFEPFFTTKQLGRGTGLGLAVVYGLVKQNEGLIHVDTALGKGTTFHLYFPRELVPGEMVEPPIGLAPAAPSMARPVHAGNGAHGKRRVLVVDDDSPIRVLCERILQDRYDVTSVSSARVALDMLRQEPYDLLLTDLIMPEMDGFELLEATVKLRPLPKLLVMTGSLTRDTESRLHGIPLGAAVIRKPFTAPTLLEIVTRCLESASHGSGEPLSHP